MPLPTLKGLQQPSFGVHEVAKSLGIVGIPWLRQISTNMLVTNARILSKQQQLNYS